jgi:phosphohistidine phosphatase
MDQGVHSFTEGFFMSRRLIIMRHAKSSQGGAASDHDRPLNEQGKEEAQQSGLKLANANWSPDYILCSDAQRTKETWEFLAPTLGSETNVRFTRELYNVEAQDVLALIEEVPDSVNTLLVIGHNPTSETLIEWLSGEYIDLGTADAALLKAPDTSWADIHGSKNSWELESVVTP